jgi:hypothetical protein
MRPHDESQRAVLSYDLEGAARALAAILRARYPACAWTVRVLPYRR